MHDQEPRHAPSIVSVGDYRVNAKNTSLLSDNKIHDDAVAKTYGFRGGLVPGVDVFAYLTHPPAERWGRAWLEHGTIPHRHTVLCRREHTTSCVASWAYASVSIPTRSVTKLAGRRANQKAQ